MFEYLKKLRKKYFTFEYLKKLLYRFTLSLLTAGASLILGLLSFGGMYALWPALIPAIISFILSVAYEGEIYSQNIERAFDKLFTQNYFKHQLAREFLKTHFKDNDSTTKKISDFRARYEEALRENDDEALLELEKLFSAQITAETYDESSDSPYAKELYEWLHAAQPGGNPSLHKQFQERYIKRRTPLLSIQLFSIITSISMGFGTTYLLVEAFTIIPMLTAIPFALWPMIIAPMAAFAGLAYGLLTYNAITNLMANDTILSWYRKLRDNLQKNPFSLKNIGMAITATLLFSMAIILTLCTAGTWWTIVQETPPLFKWMARIPAFVMGVMHPVITGFASVVFNLENSSETLSMIEALTDENNTDLSIKPLKEQLSNTFSQLWQKENILQWLNPFRLALVFIILPLRYLLFVGHLFSIGVTTDRIPGLSKYFSAFLGSLSEGFEDVHYFFKHTHSKHLDALLEERLSESQGHDHHQDLPSWILSRIAIPFYLMSALWDSCFSRLNKSENQISMHQSWKRQTTALYHADAACHDHAHDEHHAHTAPSDIETGKRKLPPYQHQKPTGHSIPNSGSRLEPLEPPKSPSIV